MTNNHADTIFAMKVILDSIVESVQEAGPQGVPGGILYAAMMSHGVTLTQFETIMGALVRAERLTRRGHLYFAEAK